MEKIVKYIAEVTEGDEYVKTGTLKFIFEEDLEKIYKENGVRILLHKQDTDMYCDVRRLYPCKIIKKEFDLVSSEEIFNSEKFKPETVEWYKEESNWQDHWC